jgi:hypothetical protein
MGAWVATANTRRHRRLECRPSDRVGADLAGRIAVPPVTGWHKTARLHRDYYVRLDGNDYSVDPAVIGRHVRVDPSRGQVTATAFGRYDPEGPKA